MASQATQSSAFIHLPVESSPTHVAEFYMTDFIGAENLPSGRNKENGSVKVEPSDNINSPKVQKGKGFDTFLMTGEMIIHTNTAVTQKLVKPEPTGKMMKESHIPRLQQKDQKQPQQQVDVNKHHPQQQGVTGSPKLHTKIPGLVKIHNSPQLSSSSSSSHNRSESQNSDSSARVQVKSFPRIQAPVAEQEELSDLSQSSCSESELGLENSSGTLTPSASLPVIHHCESSSSPSALNFSRLEQAMETLGHLQSTLPGNNTFGLSDTSFSEPPSSGDSGFVYDGHTSDSDLTDRVLNSSENTLLKETNFASDETLMGKEVLSAADNVNSCTEYSAKNPAVVSESTGEKYVVHGGNTERLLVRTSKSHENYLQASTGASLVNIDIDDNLAYSLDTLAYHDSQDSSLDSVTSEHVQVSRSLDNSPEKKSEKSSTLEREFIPGFISFDDTKSVKLKYDKQREESDVDRPGDFHSVSPPSQRLQFINRNSTETSTADDISTIQTQSESDEESLQLSLLSDEAELDIYHQPSKAVDRPSAERLAKRLFHLEGFKKSDVARHLCKKNDFSNLVAEEYLKFFEFQEDTLDQALRKFLLKFSLYGETQERERVLAHFSHRFMECNDGSFNSEDACHTLTCAIMLLNSDLHSPNVSRRMTCQEFIENLAELNDGEDFSKEVLKAIYQSIKNEPLEWAVDEASPEKEGIKFLDQGGQGQMSIPSALGSNPFLDVPDPNKTTEYKKGYVMRKCCVDPDRRKSFCSFTCCSVSVCGQRDTSLQDWQRTAVVGKGSLSVHTSLSSPVSSHRSHKENLSAVHELCSTAPFGKRGWKMLYAVLRDMILYQYKDEHQLKRGHFVESTHNAVRIHHALATKATDYTKKQHVFRLQTADGSEYLFQTGDSKELQEWIDTINLVAASLSAPVLPGAVGSRAKFQRQLLPSSYTRFNLREQLRSHETKVQELEQELHSHRAAAPEKGTRSSIIQEYLDKENYLEFEIKRFKTYVYLLQSKLMAFPTLESSLVETTIGEYEEMGAVPTMALPTQTTVVVNVAQLGTGTATRSVQRSMSDRYSYRAAIYQSDCVEYDMV